MSVRWHGRHRTLSRSRRWRSQHNWRPGHGRVTYELGRWRGRLVLRQALAEWRGRDDPTGAPPLSGGAWAGVWVAPRGWCTPSASCWSIVGLSPRLGRGLRFLATSVLFTGPSSPREETGSR
eukprot:5893188-Alexandrium_andersonii.AAC.1